LITDSGITNEYFPFIINVFMRRRRQPGSVLIPDGIAFFSELLENGVHINSVSEHDDVNNKPQSAELILLSLTIPLPQLSPFAMIIRRSRLKSFNQIYASYTDCQPKTRPSGPYDTGQMPCGQRA
jgi:hypothetical protein